MAKTKIIRLKDNPQGYKYNAQIWVDGYYTGNGKFFRTKASAEKFARARRRKNYTNRR